MLKTLMAFAMVTFSLTASAEAKQSAFMTPAGSMIVASINEKTLIAPATALGRMDYVITQQHLSNYTISNETDPFLKKWMTLVSQLAFSGNVISAQLLVNSISTLPGAKTALPTLKRVVNESTMVVDDDPLFVQAQQIIDRASSKFDKWPERERGCAVILVRSSVYEDRISAEYANKCLIKFPGYRSALQTGADVHKEMINLRKSVKS